MSLNDLCHEQFWLRAGALALAGNASTSIESRRGTSRVGKGLYLCLDAKSLRKIKLKKL